MIIEVPELNTYAIGRSKDCKINITSPEISRQHATLIQCTDTLFVLEDLDSTFGTFVNGQQIKRKIVQPGDAVRFSDNGVNEKKLQDWLIMFNINQRQIEEAPTPNRSNEEKRNDFTMEFLILKTEYEHYLELKEGITNKKKLLRNASIVASSVLGITATVMAAPAMATVAAVAMVGGTSIFGVLSSAGLSSLLPVIFSNILRPKEKLKLLDEEFDKKYRCPNNRCGYPFNKQVWDILAARKKCPQCSAIWVN